MLLEGVYGGGGVELDGRFLQNSPQNLKGFRLAISIRVITSARVLDPVLCL